MPVQTAFNAGELSPQVYGRPDLAKYANGCRSLKNMICLSHGAATRRPGTVFVAKAKNDSKKCRLIPYKYSVEQTYIHEYGDNYIRFFKDQGRIQAEGEITAISQTNPGVVTQVGHGLTTVDVIYFAGVGGMTELN